MKNPGQGAYDDRINFPPALGYKDWVRFHSTLKKIKCDIPFLIISFKFTWKFQIYIASEKYNEPSLSIIQPPKLSICCQTCFIYTSHSPLCAGYFYLTVLLRYNIHRIHPLWEYKSMIFSKFIQMYRHHHNLVFKHFHHPNRSTWASLLPTPMPVYSQFLLPIWVPGNHWSAFFSVDLPSGYFISRELHSI